MVALGRDVLPIFHVLRELASHPELRGIFSSVLQRPLPDVPTPPRPTGAEHIDDRKRLVRMLELISAGARKTPAANRACREDLAGQSLESCERRLVRKYNRYFDPRRLP
jgi:hypothetical protein